MHLSFRGWEMQETAILARFSPYLFAIPIFFLFTCTELSEFDNQQIRKALGDSLLNSTKSWDIDMNLYEEQQLIMNLKGSEALSIKGDDRSETRISGPVYITIYAEDGSVKSEVSSDSALYLPENVIFEMFGDVVVKTNDGKRLYSEYLKWERVKDRVSTDKFVTFISPPDSITAIGFFGNSNLTEYTLNEASGEVVID